MIYRNVLALSLYAVSYTHLADISTTMDIYVDVTKDMKQKEFNVLGEYFGNMAVWSAYANLRQTLRQFSCYLRRDM